MAHPGTYRGPGGPVARGGGRSPTVARRYAARRSVSVVAFIGPVRWLNKIPTNRNHRRLHDRASPLVRCVQIPFG